MCACVVVLSYSLPKITLVHKNKSPSELGRNFQHKRTLSSPRLSEGHNSVDPVLAQFIILTFISTTILQLRLSTDTAETQ